MYKWLRTIHVRILENAVPNETATDPFAETFADLLTDYDVGAVKAYLFDWLREIPAGREAL